MYAKSQKKRGGHFRGHAQQAGSVFPPYYYLRGVRHMEYSNNKIYKLYKNLIHAVVIFIKMKGRLDASKR